MFAATVPNSNRAVHLSALTRFSSPRQSEGTYIIEFRMVDGESLAISVPAGETRVLKHFQARMPYGLVVPDVP